jgi:hypothetical protein
MKIKVERVWIIVAVVAFSALMLGLAGTLPTYSQTEDDPGPQTVTGAVGEGFTYQGRLTDDNGAALDGTYEMRFLLYYDPVGGSPQYDSGPMNVAVDGGLFTVDLDPPQSVFDGEELWLAIHVEGEFLSPRQEIKPAPYALGLRPGAVVRNAATGTALRVESQDVALYGTGENFGVYGQNEAITHGLGYGGYFTSSTGVGVYGNTTAVPSTTNALPAGVYGRSEHGAGVYGEAGSMFAWGGYFDGHVRIDGSLVVSDSIFANDKSGYVLDLALNDGGQALERGDVVVVSGVADPVTGDIPVPRVRRAESEASSGVIGVVDRRYVADEAGAGGRMAEGAVDPGQYAGVVTLGAFQAIKVDAAYGAIQPGDLLVSSPTPGHAMRAENPGVGTVIGKAMEAVEEGTGVIAVMITMQ